MDPTTGRESNERKKISKWEQERGLQIRDAKDSPVNPDQEVNAEEFQLLVDANGYNGVNHEERLKFLEENRYEVTRANMVDTKLYTRLAVLRGVNGEFRLAPGEVYAVSVAPDGSVGVQTAESPTPNLGRQGQ